MNTKYSSKTATELSTSWLLICHLLAYGQSIRAFCWKQSAPINVADESSEIELDSKGFVKPKQ